MSIMRIENKWKRRMALIILAIPALVITWLNEVANVTWGVLRDFPGAVRGCWRGY